MKKNFCKSLFSVLLAFAMICFVCGMIYIAGFAAVNEINKGSPAIPADILIVLAVVAVIGTLTFVEKSVPAVTNDIRGPSHYELQDGYATDTNYTTRSRDKPEVGAYLN